jgi:V8-like Glu-specific endopeptidase
VRLRNNFLMTVLILSSSVSTLFSSQIIHQNGDFESVTFERKHYPAYAKKQSYVVKKENKKEPALYNQKCDMFLFEKKQSTITKRPERKLKTQAAVSSKNSSPQIVDHTNFGCLPFDSSGRLEAENSEYTGVGSATLFDNDVIITAGHNFVSTVAGKKHRFSQASYHHKSKHEKDSAVVKVEDIYVHPKWEEEEDSDYDIAVAFLSEKLKLVKKLSLLKSIPKKGTGVLVTGYPERTQDMHQSTGYIVSQKTKNGKKIYHDANTRVGNSGGAIVLDDEKAGAETRGRDIIAGVHIGVENKKSNRGVRLRADIMEFISTSIKKREASLIQKKQRSKKEKKTMAKTSFPRSNVIDKNRKKDKNL